MKISVIRTAAIAAICFAGPVFSDEAATMSLASTGSAGQHSGGILGDHRRPIGAIFEFEDLTCPFNEDGGMITKIVNEAMATVIPPDDFQISFITASDHDHHGHGHKPSARKGIKAFKEQRDHLLADLLSDQGGRLTFPWYRPNCAAPSFLTDHTRDLCDNYQWSAPLYDILIGTFLRADFGAQPHNHTALYGRTICQSGEELPRMLRERGVSDLNARLISESSPKACFEMLLSGEADAAIMPLLTANRLQRKHEEFAEIQSAFKLDVQMTLHAISAAGDARAASHIKALNLGVKNLKASGAWDEIVEEFFNGHDHGKSYAKAQTQLRQSAHNH